MRGCSSPQINTALTIPRVRGNPREREEEEGGGRGRRERAHAGRSRRNWKEGCVLRTEWI